MEVKYVGSYKQVLINTNTPLIFNNPLFGDINVYMDNYNNPWFMSKEVASKLGYRNTKSAIINHVLEENRTNVRVVPGGSVLKQDRTSEEILIELLLMSLVYMI